MPASLHASPLHVLALAATRLRPFDLALVAIYLVAITLFGLRFREKKGEGKTDKSLKSYFLANNTIPWWAIALSIVSAETSTLTIISVPGVAFAGNFGFLQLVIGYMLGRIVVAFLFLPRYFAGEMLTAYQLIDRRFGPVLHKVTAGLFLLTRAAAEGVRVFAVSIVVGIAIGTRDTLSIAIISALTLLYTFEGGMTAVIWTDVVQMFIYVGGTVVAIATLGTHVPGGWSTIHAVAGAAGKFHMLDFTLNLTSTYTFWAGVLGGTFLTMASHGTDQLMVQRMLAARNLRESRLALLSSGVVIFIQFTLFLFIGVGLWVYHYGFSKGGDCGGHCTASFMALHHPIALASDRIFPTFIVSEMPVGIAGLLVAAILAAAMSNLSAALNSLSSTTVVDFYMHLRPAADDRERSIVSKSSTLLWALILFSLAVVTVHLGGKGHVVEIGLSIASVAYGCLLGVFLLGTLTRYATEIGAAIGMVCGFALNLWLWQGTFPMHIGSMTIPKIAYPWYTLIGAGATFAIGSLASLIFRKQSRRTAITASTTAAVLLPLLFLLSFRSEAQEPAARPAPAQQQRDPHRPTRLLPLVSAPDFAAVSTLVNDAIAAHKLPGAVVLIGHSGEVVFHQAYGNRKLAGEPGLDGKPSPAEPMTEDTIFDMASLTKCLATATAIMQLYEQGKIASFDDPVAKYLPDFNVSSDPQRAKVTLRMLLTHTSGEAPDVSLKENWGLFLPDRAKGFLLALNTPLTGIPGAKFVYSDINFILLGALVEKVSGEREDDYVEKFVYAPLGLHNTRYHAYDSTCGPVKHTGSNMEYAGVGAIDGLCEAGHWEFWAEVRSTAPTAHDDESKADPAANPDFDHLLRGTVHDPTTRRMGGVAGHAGLFSTAHDVSLYAQALLDKLTRNTGPFPLKQSTLQLMTQPEQPGAPSVALHATGGKQDAQLRAANAATQASIAAGEKPAEPGLAPHYPAIKDGNLRGFGWDIDTGFSKPRGAIFPVGSFGHTGFTGTSLWMDPASNTYVILLANAIHPRGGAPISNLRGEVATAAALALGLGKAPSSRPVHSEVDNPAVGATTAGAPSSTTVSSSARAGIGAAEPVTAAPAEQPDLLKRRLSVGAPRQPRVGAKKSLSAEEKLWLSQEDCCGLSNDPLVLTGIDVLESTSFVAITDLAKQRHHPLNLGLLTNQSGLDAQGHRTLDLLYRLKPEDSRLTTVFSPEHGIFGKQDTTSIQSEIDPATGLAVTSLYGTGDAARRPKHEQLKDLDAVVIDLQDAGVHFWTYESVLGYFLEASAAEQTTYNHRLDIVVLDRPNPTGGLAFSGPTVDPGHTSYVAYMAGIPIRHGMTFGELARYINQQKKLNAPLIVVPMQGWQRSMFWLDTGLPWTPPSPNLRTPEAAVLYPAIGMTETTNISVGRGSTDPSNPPFSFIGAGTPPTAKAPASTATGGLASGDSTPTSAAAWFRGKDVAAYLTARRIPGATFTATTVPIAEDANHYPFHGQTIEAVHITCTDPALLDTPELGVEILAALHHLYPMQFKLDSANRILTNDATMDALKRGDDPRDVAASWKPSLDAFKAARQKALLY